MRRRRQEQPELKPVYPARVEPLPGPLPEPRLWYDHGTGKCGHKTPPPGGTNEPLWDASDMRAYAAAEVAAERERWRRIAETAQAADQASLQKSPAYLAEPGAAQATRADLVANWPEHNRVRMTVALYYTAPHAPCKQLIDEQTAAARKEGSVGWPIRGVRVDGDSVIVKAKGGNDAARWLCGAILAMREENARDTLAPHPAWPFKPGGRHE